MWWCFLTCLDAGLDCSGPSLDVWSWTSPLPLQAGCSSQLTHCPVCTLVLRVPRGVLLWAVGPGSLQAEVMLRVSDVGCWVRECLSKGSHWFCFCLEDHIFVSPLKLTKIAPSRSQLQAIYHCSRSRNCKAQTATKWCVNRTWWSLYSYIF